MMFTLATANDFTISQSGEHGVLIIGKRSPLSNAKTGDTVSIGDEIIVLGTDTVHLESLDGIVVIKAQKGSFFKYEKVDPAGKKQINMNKGIMDFKVVPGNKFDVKTPHMVAAVRGTQFTLDVDMNETALMVQEGHIIADDNRDQTLSVKAGQAIRATMASFTRDKPGTIDEIILEQEQAANKNSADRDESDDDSTDSDNTNSDDDTNDSDDNSSENSGNDSDDSSASDNDSSGDSSDDSEDSGETDDSEADDDD